MKTPKPKDAMNMPKEVTPPAPKGLVPGHAGKTVPPKTMKVGRGKGMRPN